MKKIKAHIFILSSLIIGFIAGTNCEVSGQPTLNEKDIINLSSDSPLQISEITVNSNRIGLYEKFELTFNLGGKWENPFDPEQIIVDAHFTYPDGKNMTFPGFFYQEYKYNLQNNPVKIGEPVWKVRFAPTMVGEYKYEVVVNNKGKEVKSPSQTFTSVSYGTNHGFLKISKSNPLYFEYEDGTPFFGVAQDKAGGDSRGSYKRFAEAGGNFNRLFLTGGTFNIEESVRPPMRPDRGLGKMNLESSWNVDKVLELGENLGIYHMLTLTNQTAFNGGWNSHTYNKANGGILNSSREFWTSEEAMKYFERRLRYEIARWGYSTSVFSWCFWNEFSSMQVSMNNIGDAVKWHQRMARYVASMDIFDHVIHTNDQYLNSYDQMNNSPEMEVISTNIYAVKNIAKISEYWTKKFVNQYKRPYILTEYGMGHNPGPEGYAGMDPERRMSHDGLWGPLMSGSAATGMSWEWNWLDHETFYTYINAVAKFVDGIPFSKRQWKPVNISSFKFLKPPVSIPYYSDVIVEGWPSNFRIPREEGLAQKSFEIDKNGNVNPQDLLSAVLVGPTAKNLTWLSSPNGLTQSVTFKTEYPVNGEFVVYVNEIRAWEPNPQLTVNLDNKEVLKMDLPPLQTENYNPVMYNKYFTVPVPKGPHTIQVANTGGGSFFTSFELKNYVLRNGPDVEIRGMQTDDYVLLWLKNPKFTVLHEAMKIEPKPQSEGILELNNVPDGTWVADWINTVDATVFKSEPAESKNQKLKLNTPVVEKSIAVRLRKIK